MAYFEDNGGPKAGSASEMLRLREAIAEEQQKLEKQYAALGRLYYAKYKDEPDPDLAGGVRAVAAGETLIDNYSGMMNSLFERTAEEQPAPAHGISCLFKSGGEPSANVIHMLE